jgi:hypothetical protein
MAVSFSHPSGLSHVVFLRAHPQTIYFPPLFSLILLLILFERFI